MICASKEIYTKKNQLRSLALFCQDEKDGDTRSLTKLRKLNEALHWDEWLSELIDSILDSIGSFNFIATLH